MCCGQKRSQWNKAAATPAPLQDINNGLPLPAAATPQTVHLKYIGPSYLILKGSRTGRQYYFTAAQPVLEISGGDAGAMMAHPMLVRV